ncbi:MAG: hypothetical protein JJE39_16880 [Vicinamibacteria bacterium]|nr:hypothetical protein [Vicinamibacteria bacterium]
MQAVAELLQVDFQGLGDEGFVEAAGGGRHCGIVGQGLLETPRVGPRPDGWVVSTLSTQLSWSHFLDLLPIKDPLARDFYDEMCRIERWDVRTLRKKVGGMLFQRSALSKNAKEASCSLVRAPARSTAVQSMPE